MIDFTTLLERMRAYTRARSRVDGLALARRPSDHPAQRREALQIHGAAGIAMDLPIARIYQDARAARIYDGASEVHRMTIARELSKLAMNGESTRQACGAL